MGIWLIKQEALGNFDFCLSDERFPEYIFIEDMHRESDNIKGKGTLQRKYLKSLKISTKRGMYKGIALFPVNSDVEKLYSRLGFL